MTQPTETATPKRYVMISGTLTEAFNPSTGNSAGQWMQCSDHDRIVAALEARIEKLTTFTPEELAQLELLKCHNPDIAKHIEEEHRLNGALKPHFGHHLADTMIHEALESATKVNDTLRTQLAQAQNEAMKKAVRIMEKHKKKQSCGGCCDNCNCVAMCHGLNELRGLIPQQRGR